jgi:DNA-binding MarR family transcriptional regulator
VTAAGIDGMASWDGDGGPNASTAGDQQLFSYLGRAALLLNDFHVDCFADFGLRFVDYSLLRVLELDGPPYEMAPSRLSRILLRSTGGMTQILDRLERDDLVCRMPSPSDRRKVNVQLTATGLSLVRRANAGYIDRKTKLMVGLSDEEITSLTSAVGRVLQILGNPSA